MTLQKLTPSARATSIFLYVLTVAYIMAVIIMGGK